MPARVTDIEKGDLRREQHSLQGSEALVIQSSLAEEPSSGPHSEQVNPADLVSTDTERLIHSQGEGGAPGSARPEGLGLFADTP